MGGGGSYYGRPGRKPRGSIEEFDGQEDWVKTYEASGPRRGYYGQRLKKPGENRTLPGDEVKVDPDKRKKKKRLKERRVA